MSDRKAFFKDMFPYSFDLSPETQEQTKKECESLIRHLNITSFHSVLDISCNSGVHATELAKKGLKISICDYFIDYKEESNILENRALGWLGTNILDLKEKNKYNFILNLNYLFGIHEGLEKNKEFLMRLNSYLAPGGKLVMRLIGRDILDHYFQPKYWCEQHDGSYLLNHRNIDYENGWLEDNYVYVKGELIKKYQCGMKVYYPWELTSLLEENGFIHVKISGDLDGSEYSEKSPCMFVIAEKVALENKNYIRC